MKVILQTKEISDIINGINSDRDVTTGSNVEMLEQR